MGLALVVGMTNTTPRHLRSLFASGSRRRGLLLTAAIGMAVLGCVDGSPTASGDAETGEETSSSDADTSEPAMDDGGPSLGDVGGPDTGDVGSPDTGDGESSGDGDGDGGDGDGDEGETDEPDICGDGIVGPTEACDVGIDEQFPCAAGPGASVCAPDCTLSDAYCDCELGSEACLCGPSDACDPGLECCFGEGGKLCQPAPPACVLALEPCLAVDTCCSGLSCIPDTSGQMVCPMI